jgi:hypothetical protein
VTKNENHIMFSPQQYERFIFSKKIKNITVLKENVQDLIDIEARQQFQNSNNIDFFSKYHNYQGIQNFLKSLEKEFPGNTETFVLGNTFEKRNVTGIKIFDQTTGNIFTKKNVWLSSLQHSREW